MKKIITSREDKALQKIDNINIDQDALNILMNPNDFFLPYTKSIKNPIAIALSRFSILIILKNIDGNNEIVKKHFDYFLQNYTIEEWFEKLDTFYSLALSCAQFLLDNHDNFILDAYNEKRINDHSFNKTMEIFNTMKPLLLTDAENLKNCLNEIEIEKQRLKEEYPF
jgi:hypothetical protein